MDEVSIKVRNYRSFREKAQGFNSIKPINILIGKNNSGKSTLLDIVSANADPERISDQLDSKNLDILISGKVNEKMVAAIFRSDTNSGGHSFSSDRLYGQTIVGKNIIARYSVGKGVSCELLDFEFTKAIQQEHNRVQAYSDSLAQALLNPLAGKSVFRIAAERNILPESSRGNLEVTADGSGVTNIIQRYINDRTLSSDKVESLILNDLNNIFGDDGFFDRISTQYNPDNQEWEIYLHEKNKGSIKLSSSGSGLKTILQVLVTMRLKAQQDNLANTIFTFEELENNLHPGVLRRLYFYIEKFALQHGSIFFITTHSNVVIDMFSTSKDAQIIHLTHDGKASYANEVLEYLHKDSIFNDLDIRASDLLQSNSVIWVEGPSDIIYVNKWIDIWSNGKLRQGAHYQCVCYGGSLLAYLYSSDGDEFKNAVNTLKVNRNMIIIIDSDRRSVSAKINKNKSRIIKEVDAFGGKAWVTKGKEIENYLSKEALSKKYSKNLPQLKQFELIDKYLDVNISKKEGKKFLASKVQFATDVSELLEANTLHSILDLDKQMKQVVSQIKAWNKIP